MKKKLSLTQLEVKSFTTNVAPNPNAIRGGLTLFGSGCGTQFQNCDTGNEYCTWVPTVTQAVNCTGNCSYLC